MCVSDDVDGAVLSYVHTVFGALGVPVVCARGAGGPSPIMGCLVGFIVRCCVTMVVSSMQRFSEACAIWSMASIIFMDRDFCSVLNLGLCNIPGWILGMAANGDG